MITGAKLIEVVSITAKENYKLDVQFNDGQRREVDLSNLLKNPPPVFKKLCDTKEFKKVTVNPIGGIQWECGADLSAEYLLSPMGF